MFEPKLQKADSIFNSHKTRLILKIKSCFSATKKIGLECLTIVGHHRNNADKTSHCIGNEHSSTKKRIKQRACETSAHGIGGFEP